MAILQLRYAADGTMTLPIYVTGAGGTSLAGVLLSEQSESKRERAGPTGDHAAGERARSARAAGRAHAPPQVPPSPSSSPPPSPSSSPPATAAHPGQRFGRRAAARRGRGRPGRPRDARRRGGRRRGQHGARRRRAQDDRPDLQRRAENGHVHPRQGDHLRERARGPRASGRIPAAAAVALTAVGRRRADDRSAAADLRHTEVRRHDRPAPAPLSAAAAAARGRPAADGAPRRQRDRAELRRRDHHDDGSRAVGARRGRPGRRRCSCSRATTDAHRRSVVSRRVSHAFPLYISRIFLQSARDQFYDRSRDPYRTLLFSRS